MPTEDGCFYLESRVVLFGFSKLNLRFMERVKAGWTAQQGTSTKRYARWLMESACKAEDKGSHGGLLGYSECALLLERELSPDGRWEDRFAFEGWGRGGNSGSWARELGLFQGKTTERPPCIWGCNVLWAVAAGRGGGRVGERARWGLWQARGAASMRPHQQAVQAQAKFSRKLQT